MKTYNSPMLQVVSIKKSNIIVTSPLSKGETWLEGDAVLSAGRRNVFDEWYEGY